MLIIKIVFNIIIVNLTWNQNVFWVSKFSCKGNCGSHLIIRQMLTIINCNLYVPLGWQRVRCASRSCSAVRTCGTWIGHANPWRFTFGPLSTTAIWRCHFSVSLLCTLSLSLPLRSWMHAFPSPTKCRFELRVCHRPAVLPTTATQRELSTGLRGVVDNSHLYTIDCHLSL